MNNALSALKDLRMRAHSKSLVDPDQEGWLVSYADLITLLFIFFSIMLSISAISKSKFELLTHEFNQSSVTSLTELKTHLDSQIQKENIQSDVTTEMTDQGLEIRFSERVLFALGAAEISSEGAQILKKFSHTLGEIKVPLQLAVEGHTDSRPIHTAAFPSNWALSASRSVNVLHFLAANGVNEKRMMVRAYADTHPLKEETPQTALNEKNRRVTLLVF